MDTVGGTDHDPDPEFAILDPSHNPTEALPRLSASPKAYPGCCLGLSTTFLSSLCNILPAAPAPILSIGSGYGLLEALLLSEPYSVNIIGVEVQPSSNKYLPASHHHVVTGTRFLDDTAQDARAWLFVYPRRVGLVHEYIRAHGQARVSTIVWAGPRADWEDYAGCFDFSWHVELTPADAVGGRSWELIAIAKKHPE
ncbi:hypothetical protein B0J11DRAFT_88380 [Dendryphion nanum]|uniref:Uncharacterized protein n=1 Tax=Dendryphion nanum TaxID=256645 RepID=A0A9P9DE76_9PLEO|nr:hypothetical protein B0J11DRAFT_88380 [Dendryphion nanum]